jgi:general secretion pathway protein G
MRPLRRSEPGVFFPWEKRRGLFGAIGRTRARMVALLVSTVALLVVLHRREETAAAVRATRSTLTTAGRAISSYRADHASACPRAVSDLVVGGYLREDPVDAWGRPLRLVCPGRRDPLGFDLSSDGPDGLAGGLDRLE